MGANQPDYIEGMCSLHPLHLLQGGCDHPPLLLLRDLNEIMQVQCIAQGLARDTFSKRIFIEK